MERGKCYNLKAFKDEFPKKIYNYRRVLQRPYADDLYFPFFIVIFFHSSSSLACFLNTQF